MAWVLTVRYLHGYPLNKKSSKLHTKQGLIQDFLVQDTTPELGGSGGMHAPPEMFKIYLRLFLVVPEIIILYTNKKLFYLTLQYI
jgi:hypothetical protein